MFEILEYTLEHQLPNFSECWWDHVGSSHLLSLQILRFAFISVDYGRAYL